MKGRIVNLGDWATDRPYKDYLPYLVGKGGLTTMTLALATVTQLLMLVEPQLLRLMIDRYVMRAASLTPRQFFAGVAAGFNANPLITPLDPILATLSTDGADEAEAEIEAPTS